MEHDRVISLIASATETVCALGAEDRLVGRSHECDYPVSVARLPVCTEPKFDVDGSSYELDARVRAIVQNGLSVYRVFADRLAELSPDLILTQSHCEVCAVSLRDVEEAVHQIVGSQPALVSLEPTALDDVFRDILRIANTLGIEERGRALTAQMQRRMADIQSRTETLSPKPTVACIEWIDPLMAAGNWMPELVDIAGGRNLFGKAGRHSPRLEWEALCEADPDVIVVLPCGWSADRAREEMPTLVKRPGWKTLKAVCDQRVFLTDGNQYLNRPGPRLVESLEILAEIAHPGQFEFGHENTGWQRFFGA